MKAGWSLVEAVRLGSQYIMNAFERPNPVLKLILDIIQVVVDIGTALAAVQDFSNVQIPAINSYGGKTFTQKFKYMLDKAAKDQKMFLVFTSFVRTKVPYNVRLSRRGTS